MTRRRRLFVAVRLVLLGLFLCGSRVSACVDDNDCVTPVSACFETQGWCNQQSGACEYTGVCGSDCAVCAVEDDLPVCDWLQLRGTSCDDGLQCTSLDTCVPDLQNGTRSVCAGVDVCPSLALSNCSYTCSQTPGVGCVADVGAPCELETNATTADVECNDFRCSSQARCELLADPDNTTCTLETAEAHCYDFPTCVSGLCEGVRNFTKCECTAATPGDCEQPSSACLQSICVNFRCQAVPSGLFLCDDEDSCNGADHCESGLCVANDPGTTCPNCFDCVNGTCQFSAQNTSCGGSTCSPLVCDGQGTCVSTSAAGAPCVRQCNVTADAFCEDGDCKLVNDAACLVSCLNSTDCNDNNPCTQDICDFNASGVFSRPGACAFLPLDSIPCDDGIWCNGEDTCDAGSCSIHAGDPCTQGDVCSNTCSEALATCNVPRDIIRETSDFCSLAVCQGNGSYTLKANCDDPCFTCDGTGRQCVRRPDQAPCSSGDWCQMDQVCLAGVCTGGRPRCSGNHPCNSTCNSATQSCARDAGDVFDGMFCSGSLVYCDGFGGYLIRDPRPCAPTSNDPCKQTKCNETLRSCVFPVGIACDDNNFCTEQDQCVEGGVCVGVPKVCSGTCEIGTCNISGQFCTPQSPLCLFQSAL